MKLPMSVDYREPLVPAETVFDLWMRDELADYVHIPDGWRVEVVEGKVVASPSAAPIHNGIVTVIGDAVALAQHLRSDFPWTKEAGSGLGLGASARGCVPDLMILSADVLKAVHESRTKRFSADEIELVVEITSPGNAEADRRPLEPQHVPSKWNSYAASGIPYYLLVDADPKVARTTLYSIPDEGAAAYLHDESWAFGQTVHLPDPFDLQIDTTSWFTW
ncbi:Uma2 family endonuclease [Actinomadura rupiterrae]|uniref:Uma2 family endonuclease n=1 Tax=Actinomadura rupiterrae TaxID=559627 RepID=UPI0020A35DBC|nr:Uma2 family endonuclease [Actinomadura rupiterrae]MCP2340086.1 Uma2 family endonuclease [Actinomadura rupiterrae]